MFGVIDIIRYAFYALDFIFGVVSWGVTADKLDGTGVCLLSNSTERALSTASCDVVIAFGVITMILLVLIVVLRSLDIFGIITFSNLIEMFAFALMTVIWFILAIVTVSVTGSEQRKLSAVRGAAAGAWIAFFTHTGSTIVAWLARKREGEFESKE